MSVTRPGISDENYIPIYLAKSGTNSSGSGTGPLLSLYQQLQPSPWLKIAVDCSSHPCHGTILDETRINPSTGQNRAVKMDPDNNLTSLEPQPFPSDSSIFVADDRWYLTAPSSKTALCRQLFLLTKQRINRSACGLAALGLVLSALIMRRRRHLVCHLRLQNPCHWHDFPATWAAVAKTLV